ncbi:MAG: ABC transporter ATP-binding protein [Deltaproteobacteria bacterium]|nr:ABC transporter ATP-binding protein [Deltaproteobacteria bacterium]
MSTNGGLLEIREAALHFGKVAAVDGVDLTIKEGDLTGIIGPNGAGKTSLFNLITGHYPPTKGIIRFAGRRISGLSSHRIARLGIARSFQITNIFPTLTTFENVQVAYLVRRGQSLNLFSRFSRLGRKAVAEILETVGLTDKADTLAGYLSHGDQRTLEIGITLASEPKLLLLDEPTSGMSSWETKLVTDLIEKISREMSIPILFVEHDMSVAFTVARQIVVMHQGRVFAQGAPQDIRGNEAVRNIYLGEED